MLQDKVCFVQFLHPGGEHRPNADGLDWNKLPHPHRRKFLLGQGRFVEEKGVRSGSFAFWGEWEAQSLRRNVERLIEQLAGIDGLRDLTMTTNGVLLASKARTLREAGLQRVTVSLDSLEDDVFKAMNDVGFPVAQVLKGIEAAARAALTPVKVNMVVKRGVNDHSVLDMAHHFRGTGHVLRFIEYMDVGTTNGWRLEDVVPAAEIVRSIDAFWPLEPVERNYRGEVARRYRYRDGAGEIGVIASVTQPFCRVCTRARLSADGQLYSCMFASRGHDLRSLLRGGRQRRRDRGAPHHHLDKADGPLLRAPHR